MVMKQRNGMKRGREKEKKDGNGMVRGGKFQRESKEWERGARTKGAFTHFACSSGSCLCFGSLACILSILSCLYPIHPLLLVSYPFSLACILSILCVVIHTSKIDPKGDLGSYFKVIWNHRPSNHLFKRSFDGLI